MYITLTRDFLLHVSNTSLIMADVHNFIVYSKLTSKY